MPPGHIPLGPPPTPIPVPGPAPVPVPTPLPAPMTPAVTPDGVSRLNTQLADIPCSVLRAESEAWGRLTVRGVVGKTDDRERILAVVRNAIGGITPNLELEVMSWPQCEVRMTFAPALERPAGLAIRIRPPAGTPEPNKMPPVLNDGAPLVLEVTTPTFPSYLYVVYLQVGGEAVYLHTPATTNGRPWPAGSRVVIGDGSDNGPAMVIGQPFGTEMILAVAAPFALTTTELPTSTTEREFLSLFRKALLGRGTRGVKLAPADRAAASYALVTTRATEAH